MELESILKLVGGVDRLMFTLIQALLVDSIHDIMRRILHFIGWSWFYFYGYLALAYLVLMNLVTAIIVDNALTITRNDEDSALQQREASKKRGFNELHTLFKKMDSDASGTL